MALDHGVFLQTFNRLAVAMQATRADSAMQEVYFKALEEYPSAHVSQAALMIAKQPDRKYFPTTGEWVAAIFTVKAAEDRKIMSSHPRNEPWHHDHDDCEDTGWVFANCDGLKEYNTEPTVCGRRFPHTAHPYAFACPCRETNKTYQRHCAAERKRA